MCRFKGMNIMQDKIENAFGSDRLWSSFNAVDMKIGHSVPLVKYIHRRIQNLLIKTLQRISVSIFIGVKIQIGELWNAC